MESKAASFTGVPEGFIRRSDFGSKSDFVFGSATSAFQIEGATTEDGRGPSIWDTFAAADKKNLFAPYDADAVCHYKKFEEDVKIMKEIGFDAYRFSISWSRILPTGKRDMSKEGSEDGRNQKGIDFYKKLLMKLKENDIVPFVTLLHFDLPQKLEDDYKGFLSHQIVDDFANYADICFEEFGNYVNYWITINEPWSYAYGGYASNTLAPYLGTVKDTLTVYSLAVPKRLTEIIDDGCMLPPSRFSFQPTIVKQSLVRSMVKTLLVAEPTKDVSVAEEITEPFKYPYIVAHNQLLAHAKAVNLYRRKYQNDQKGKIGISLVAMWCTPLSDDPKDKEAADRALDFILGWFMRPLVEGKYPDSMVEHASWLPDMSKDGDTIKETYDFIGLNYYTAAYIAHCEGSKGNYITDQQLKWHAKDKHDKYIAEEKGGSGWIYSCPKGILEVLLHVKKTYNDPVIYITENGFDDLDDDSSTRWKSFWDQTRISYLHDHLSFVLKAKQQKVQVMGYFVWSLLDNFEWDMGFKARFGITYVDYDDGAKRYPKLSAKWLKQLLAN